MAAVPECVLAVWHKKDCTVVNMNTGRPPYPQLICSKTYCGYVRLQKIPNAIYNVIIT